MMARAPLQIVVATLMTMAVATPWAAADERIIANPNPDRTWASKVGGIFTSGKSIAVVIGISNYIGERAGGYPPLPTAKPDAEKMINFLINDAGFDTVYVLTDNDATKQKIDQLMTDTIPGIVKSTDRFLFYWSGHGDQRPPRADGSTFGFLPLTNSKRNEFYAMISMDDISRWDRYLSARHSLFVLDACLSGLAGAETKAPRDSLLEQLSLSAHHLLTAGTAKENVISGDKWTGSLFTDSFILGAKGQASGSLGLGVVSLFSLIDFIQRRVVIEKQAAYWSKSLTPQLRSLQAGDGGFYFVSTRQVVGPPPVGSGAAPVEPKGIGGGIIQKPEVALDTTKLIYSPWAKLCGKGQDAAAKEVCFTGKDARTEAGQPVVAAALIETQGERKKLFRVTLPSGLQVQYGVRIIIDKEPAISGAFFSCTANSCVADYEGTPDLVGKLKKGQMLVIQAVNLAAAAISFPLPLVDFATVNETPRVGQPTEEQQKLLGGLREPYLEKPELSGQLTPQLIYSPWTKSCGKGQDPNAKEVCSTGKDARTEAGQPVVAAALIEPQDELRKLFRVTLPGPLQLQYGVRIIIDKEPAISGAFFSCTANGCVADYEGTPDLVGKLKKGRMLVIQAINLAQAAISFPLPLTDTSGNSFQKANDGPPTDPKVFEENQKKLQEELQKRARKN